MTNPFASLVDDLDRNAKRRSHPDTFVLRTTREQRDFIAANGGSALLRKLVDAYRRELGAALHGGEKHE